MKKVIVTGANGYIGSHFVSYLISLGIDVIAMDKDGFNSNVPESVRFVPFDFNNTASLDKLIGDRDIDTVFHLAWIGVSGALRSDTDAQILNIKASIELLKACKTWGCKRFVCMGSIMELEAIAAANTDGIKPGMGYVYGDAKHYTHLATKSLAASLGIEHIWPMLTNTYGEGELSPRFINTTLKKIIHNESLEFTSGTQIYDFVYIDDTVKALYLIGEKGRAFNSYLIGSGNAAPLRSFIECIGKTLAPGCELHFGTVPFAGVSLQLTDYDITKTKEDTGFTPEISFEEGIQRTMKWLRSAR